MLTTEIFLECNWYFVKIGLYMYIFNELYYVKFQDQDFYPV